MVKIAQGAATMTNYELYVTESKKLNAAIGSIYTAQGRTPEGELEQELADLKAFGATIKVG